MGGNSASRLLDSTLLTPDGNVTKINRKDFRNLDEHVKPGDRIAWHRPYMLIHEAIVLKVDAEKSEVWVFERTITGSSSSSSSSNGSGHSSGTKNRDKRSKNKSSDDNSAPYGPGIAKITKVNLTSQSGQLYRYNDTHNTESLMAILKQVLMNLDSRGYNLLAHNCQTSASGVQTDGKDKSSHQTRWFALMNTLEAAGIPSFSEILEAVCGGAEWIGIVSAGIMHATAFVIELIAALFKYKRKDMSWDDLRTVISRQLFMHVVGWFGNFLSSFTNGGVFLQTRGILPFVLAVFFAIVADALFLYAGFDPDSWWRYLPMALGTVTGLFLGFAATGAYLEFMVSMILGFAGKFVGHSLYHAGSWLFEWLKSERFKGKYVTSIKQLKKGDHITTYEGFWHPHCHAIFDKCNDGKMTIIRNTYRHGVIEAVVPFYPNWVYRYDYPPEKARCDEDVVRIARSKIGGSNEYSWVSYNCKTFSEQCKLVHVCSGSNVIDWKVHFDEIMEDDNISEEDKKTMRDNFLKFQESLSPDKSCTHDELIGKNNQEATIPDSKSMPHTDEDSNIQNDTTSQENPSACKKSRGRRRRPFRVAMRSLICIQ